MLSIRAVPSPLAAHMFGPLSNMAASITVSFIFYLDASTCQFDRPTFILVPPILLASIALQESSCNPSTVGGNGEQGLMQLTVDKCGGAPGGNCQDVVRIIFFCWHCYR